MDYTAMGEQEYIFAGIFTLANRLQRLGDKLDDHMTIKQWMLIAVVTKAENQMLTISEAAAVIGSSHQNIKKMAVILEKQGFLTLSKAPEDGRVVRLSLTDYCKNYFSERDESEQAFLAAVFQGFDEEATAGLYKGLRLLQQNIEKLEKKDDL
ncbi:MarR family winged helix-turn-helix transcriptional regulator [Enterococcus sp. LJL51]|uniref:MarR family winged helix-turn-helix transcriptional regulator n=1 Tax=Enterococcus sp. LJL51 TaxID=3416656 RepID=UPI003CEFA0E5